MCWVAAAASAGLGIASSVMQYRAAGEQAKAQAEGAIKSMNREFMNDEIERQDAFDAAVEDITKTRLNALDLTSSVNAAVNEEIGNGRTAALLERNVQGDEARNVASIQSNYESKSNEIDLNKETQLLSTKEYISNIKPPSKTALMLNIASNIVGGITGANNAKAEAATKGMDWDFWKGAVKHG